MTLETKADYARRHGVSKPAVGKWEERGWLVMSEGKVDVEESDKLLKKFRSPSDPRAKRGAAATGKPTASKPESAVNRQPPRAALKRAGESSQQAADRLIASVGANLSYDEARTLKENYLALLNQLEYDERSGAVVKAEDVAAVVGAELATVRTKLLAIPSEHAPRIARLKTATEVQDALQEVIVEALSELTQDVQR